MKSRLFLAALATLSLAACSNDDVVNVPQQSSDAITFRSSVKNSRGTATETSTLKQFWVKAVDAETKAYLWTHTDDNSGMLRYALNGNIFEAQDAGQNILQWPTGKTIEFFATSLPPKDYTADGVTIPGFALIGPAVNDKAKYNNFKPASNIADQVDFIYASNKGSRSNFDASVPLRFKHALSQIIIKAKNTNSQYTVRVKGYKLVYLYGGGTFEYDYPVTIESQTNASSGTVTYTAETPDGSWTSLNKVNNVSGTMTFSNYVSAFYGGDGYSDANYTGLSDPTEYNHYKLTGNEITIAGSATEGAAMLIPQKIQKLGEEDKNNQGAGFYIAVLVQIDDADGTPVYPGLRQNETLNTNPQRVSYVGLPKGYGYVAAPISINWEAGKTYTYILDFSNGAGYVDPDKPHVSDPEHPDQPGDDDEDPHSKGDDVLGHNITFTQEVTPWVVAASTTDYPLEKPM